MCNEVPTLRIHFAFRRRTSCLQHDPIPAKKIQENLPQMDPREWVQEIPRRQDLPCQAAAEGS